MVPIDSSECDLYLQSLKQSLIYSIEIRTVDPDHIDPDLNVISPPNCQHYNHSNLPLTNNIVDPHARPPFSLFHANVRSINRNYQELQNCLELTGFQFSIIALTETWLNDINQSLSTIPNYTPINATRKDRVGGGISIHVNENLQFKKLPFNEMNDTIESLFIEITDPTSHTNFIVGVIYRPPNGSISNFTTAITDILEKICPKRKTCYILGDFNIDLNKFQSLPDTTEFFNLLYSYSFVPLIDKSTRVSSSTSTLIDNIFTNQQTINHKSGVIQADISDHFPIFTISEIPSPMDPNKKIKFRSFKQANVDRFILALRNESWENVYSTNNAQVAYSAFADTLTAHYDSVFPIIERKPSKRDSNQWITRGLKVSIKQKNKLYIRYKNSPTFHNNIIYKQLIQE